MSSESAMEKVNKDAAEVNTSAAAAEVSSAPSTTPTQGAEGIKPHNRCDELKQQIAAAISIVDKFRLSNRNEEAAATDKDAVPAPDTDSSKRPTIPVSGGQETASSSGSAGSEASYSEETSCEIEESSIATHHLVANDYISPFGEIPFEHLANPEKYNNQYIEVKKSALGGMGVFAKTDLKKGQLILAERPTFSADPESLYEELEKIAPELLAAFKRMHGHKRYPDQEDRAAIFLTNAFAFRDKSSIYLIASRFNHSCKPLQSVEYHTTVGKTMEFRMVKDATKGEELTISYGPLDPKQLYTMWGFRCACGGCKPLSDKDVARIDGDFDAEGIW
ncbi:SET domain-containing protein [Jackrogersella minutella]|nr:SET domain-containing protein [Jackrogersella minutella]